MENKKLCPFKFNLSNEYVDVRLCEQENCGLWCNFDGCCALVAIAAEIHDKECGADHNE